MILKDGRSNMDNLVENKNYRIHLITCIVFIFFNQIFLKSLIDLEDFLYFKYRDTFTGEFMMDFLRHDWQFFLAIAWLMYAFGIINILYFSIFIKSSIDIKSALMYLITIILSCYIFSPLRIYGNQDLFRPRTLLFFALYLLEMELVIYFKNKKYSVSF